jgi:hypothetical protein
MLLNFPRCLSILLLQTSKTGNNALDIAAIYNLKLKHYLIPQTQIKRKISIASHYAKTTWMHFSIIQEPETDFIKSVE